MGAARIQNVPPFTRVLSVAPLSTPRRQVRLEIARECGKGVVSRGRRGGKVPRGDRVSFRGANERKNPAPR